MTNIKMEDQSSIENQSTDISNVETESVCTSKEGINTDKQEETLAQKIGKNLRKLIDHHGLSIRGVGRAICVAQPHLTRMIHGMHQSPGIEIVDKIASYFNVSIEELLGKNGKEINFSGLKKPMLLEKVESDTDSY